MKTKTEEQEPTDRTLLGEKKAAGDVYYVFTIHSACLHTLLAVYNWNRNV